MTFCDFKKTIRLNEFERFKALIYSFNIKLQKLYKKLFPFKSVEEIDKKILVLNSSIYGTFSITFLMPKTSPIEKKEESLKEFNIILKNLIKDTIEMTFNQK